MSKLNALIAGSTGYIGIQLVKLLIKHPNINIKYLCGNTSIGKSISYFDKTIKNKKLPKIIKFNNNLLNNVDVVFTALPNGQSQKISNKLLKKNILIDLSADFRLKSAKEYLRWYKIKHSSKNNIKNSIYALPEISKKKLKNYKIISCPGCYPTSVLLPLIPLIKNNLIETKNIIIDSKSGYSGAGRSVHKKYAKKNLYGSLSAYGVGFHRHNSEIQQELNNYSKNKIEFTFTPHLSPMFRGILSTIYLELKKNISINHINSKLLRFYKKDSFIKVLPVNSLISTNDVINTNYCHVSVCKLKNKNKFIILSAIDNLIKGGAGQAVQNLNYYFGYNIKKGLM
ncbi:N-acetyl-gamma-glutamyl-phosphate reductase [Candidatus Pelagibacter sp.]|nr:N-acetyl-gamma-glutamyl-phosphate reductase [Candidatus Pelagibacter sp.]